MCPIVVVTLGASHAFILLEVEEIRQEACNTLRTIPEWLLVPAHTHPIRILVPPTRAFLTLYRQTTVADFAEVCIGRAGSTLISGGIEDWGLVLAVLALAVDQVGFLPGAGSGGGVGAIDVVLTYLVGEPGGRAEFDQFAGEIWICLGCGYYWLLAVLVIARIVEQVLVVLVLPGVFVLKID